MKPFKEWGTGLFTGALLLLPLGLLLVYRLPPDGFAPLYATGLPLLTIISALLSLAGTVSAYPRVRNLHLLIPGGSVCLIAVLTALQHLIGPFPGLSLPKAWLPLALQFSLLPALFLPSLVNSRLLKRIGGAYSLLFLLLIFLPLAGELPQKAMAKLQAFPASLPLLIQLALLAATGSLTLLRLRNEFSLGGMITGISFLAGLSWLTALRPAARELSQVYMAALPIFTAAGTLVHRIRRMEHRALYDPLLQIYNRGYCDTVLKESGGLSTAPPFSVALFDLDHFKQINDTYGHQAGDAVLFAAAQSIQNQLIPGGTVCRYGGEEIIAFFPGMSGREVLPDLERCRRAVESLRIPAAEKVISVTVSCGAGERIARTETAEDALKKADAALYRAKNKGRNRIELEEAGKTRGSATRAGKGSAPKAGGGNNPKRPK